MSIPRRTVSRFSLLHEDDFEPGGGLNSPDRESDIAIEPDASGPPEESIAPQPFPTLIQNVFQAIRQSDVEGLRKLLESATDAAALVQQRDPSNPKRNFDWPVTPLSLALHLGREDLVAVVLQHTPRQTLSDAIQFEQEMLVDSLRVNDRFERHYEYDTQRRERLLFQHDDRRPSITQSEVLHDELGYSEQPPRTPRRPRTRRDHHKAQTVTPGLTLRPDNQSWLERPLDSVTISLRSLILTKGNAEILFGLWRRSSLSLQGAQYCDIGRTLWFWAAQKDIPSIVDSLLDDGFPIDFRSTKTALKSPGSRYESQMAIDPVPVGTTALWNAARRGAKSTLTSLLSRGALLNQEVLRMENKAAAVDFVAEHTSSETDWDDGEIVPDSREDAKDRLSSLTYGPGTETASIVRQAIKQQELLRFGGQGGNESLDELLAASQGLQNTQDLASNNYYDEEYQRPDHEAYSRVIELLLIHGSNANIIPTITPVYRQDPTKSKVVPVLLQCAGLGALTAVRTLIKAGANVYARCDTGKTLLHYAVRSQNEDLVKLAIGLDASVNIQDMSGYAAIHECIVHGNEAVLNILIHAGADVNLLTSKSLSPLLMAANLDKTPLAKLLLANRADPNQSVEYSSAAMVDDLGDKAMANGFSAGTPLLASLHKFKDNMELIELLLEYGADPSQSGLIAHRKHSKKQAPHRWEPSWGWDLERIQTILYVISRFAKQIFSTDIEYFTQQYKILMQNYREKVGSLPQWLLDECLRGLCVTYLASDWPMTWNYSGMNWRVPYEAIEISLEAGANSKVRGRHGLTLLHTICCQRSEVNESKLEQVLRLLVNRGVDVNAEDDLGRTPLHYAAAFCPPAVEILIELGADCTARGRTVGTPFHTACEKHCGFQTKSFQALLRASITGYIDWKAVLLVVCQCLGEEHVYGESEQDLMDIISGLIQKADRPGRLTTLDLRDRMKGACSATYDVPLKALCASPHPWQTFAGQDELGRTPLILASQKSDARVRAVLAAIRSSTHDRGAFFKQEENYRHLRPAYKQFSQVDSALLEELRKTGATTVSASPIDPSLRERGITGITPEGLAQCLNMRDVRGWTALHYAASLGLQETVKLLLDEPAVDVGTAKGCCMKTPLELARLSDTPNCARLIKAAIDDREAIRATIQQRKKALEAEDVAKHSGGNNPTRPLRQKPRSSTNVADVMARLEVRIAGAVLVLAWLWLYGKF